MAQRLFEAVKPLVRDADELLERHRAACRHARPVGDHGHYHPRVPKIILPVSHGRVDHHAA
eukprot:38360-Eustigmatos_ZCMA.PRE.1